MEVVKYKEKMESLSIDTSLVADLFTTLNANPKAAERATDKDMEDLRAAVVKFMKDTYDIVARFNRARL